MKRTEVKLYRSLEYPSETWCRNCIKNFDKWEELRPKENKEYKCYHCGALPACTIAKRRKFIAEIEATDERAVRFVDACLTLARLYPVQWLVYEMEGYGTVLSRDLHGYLNKFALPFKHKLPFMDSMSKRQCWTPSSYDCFWVLESDFKLPVDLDDEEFSCETNDLPLLLDRCGTFLGKVDEYSPPRSAYKIMCFDADDINERDFTRVYVQLDDIVPKRIAHDYEMCIIGCVDETLSFRVYLHNMTGWLFVTMFGNYSIDGGYYIDHFANDIGVLLGRAPLNWDNYTSEDEMKIWFTATPLELQFLIGHLKSEGFTIKNSE